jgi:glutaminyl-tRNA synthetase
VEVRLYDRLFAKPIPGSDDPEGKFLNDINQNSIEVLSDCRVETGILSLENQKVFQFERMGYFYQDPLDSLPNAIVFNRTVTLRDSWARLEQEQN